MMVLDEADFMLTNEVTSRVFDRAFNVFQKAKRMYKYYSLVQLLM